MIKSKKEKEKKDVADSVYDLRKLLKKIPMSCLSM